MKKKQLTPINISVDDALRCIGMELCWLKQHISNNVINNYNPFLTAYSYSFPIDDLFRFIYYTLVSVCNSKVKIPGKEFISNDPSPFEIMLNKKYRIWYCNSAFSPGVNVNNNGWYLVRPEELLLLISELIKTLGYLSKKNKKTKIIRRKNTVYLNYIG